MKTILAILITVLLSAVSFSQNLNINGGGVMDIHTFKQVPIYAHDTIGNSRTDTTGYFTIEPYREVAFLFKSTDSVVADVYFDSRNSGSTSAPVITTYTDSIKLADSVTAGPNSGISKVILLKTTTLNRLNQPGANQFRLRVASRSSGNGTTAARQFRGFLILTN